MILSLSKNAFVFIVFAMVQLTLDIISPLVLTPTDMSNWVGLRTILLGVCPLLLFGFDQYYIRQGQISLSFKKVIGFLLLIQVCILSIILVSFRLENFISHYFMCNAVIFFLIASVLLRAKSRFILAQLQFHGWKLLALISLLVIQFTDISSETFIKLLSIMMLVALSVSVAYFFNLNNQGVSSNQSKDVADHPEKIQPLIFFVFAVTLSFANYFEHYIIFKVLSPYRVGEYFTHVIIFGGGWMLISNAAAFYLTPQITKVDTAHLVKILNKKNICLSLGAIILFSIFAVMMGSLAYQFFYTNTYELNYFLVMIVTISFLLRFLYSLISSIVGMKSPPEDVRLFLNICLAGLSSQLIFFFVFYYLSIFNSLDLNLMYIIAFSTLLNWTFRLSGGIYIFIKLLKSI